MKKSISLLSFLLSAVIALVAGAVLGVASGLPVLAVSAIVFAASFVPMPAGAFMAIQREVWLTDIVENLWTTNPHMKYAYDADSFVLGGKVVHIPNSGTAAAVTRNQASLPVAVVTRTDQDITFSLDEYTTAPVLITNADEAELSYDKRQSVIGDASNSLAELVGDWMLYYWAPSALTQMVRTSGASAAAHIGTGVRKAVTVADIMAVEAMMNANKMPMKDRYAILDAYMYAQLQADLSATQYRDFSSHQNVEEGVLGKLYGFTFLDPRSFVLKYSNASTPVVYEPGATGADTDYAAGLFWHKSAVVRALGQNEFFENVNDPTYYGSIYSALLRAGGRKRRYDAKGVIALVQLVHTP